MASQSTAVKALLKEREKIWPKVEHGRVTQPDEDDPFTWELWIQGPDKYSVDDEIRDCPYKGKQFRLTLKYPDKYPMESPSMKFDVGALYHPNVDPETGEICMEGINKPTVKIDRRAEHVFKLLSCPDLGNALNADAASEMREDVKKYESKAREAAKKAPNA
eukprot:gb/GECG01003737.1/.p1 GENE.gb/GECG01003737.1/~~gb/GECG01003737.1/.p1  ORF type:complete len:162 (+),score=28.17 gb/GECG01003737.1/:1-486(+)